MQRSSRKTARVPARWMVMLAALLIVLGSGTVAAPVWAAPVVQTAEASSLVGTYQSEVLAAPDSTGLVVSLSLNEDGSAELMSDYLNEDEPIVEVGEWFPNDDGTVTLTVTGTAERAYPQPIDLTFQVDENGALVIPGEPSGPFGEAGLTLAPTDLPVAAPELEAPAVDLSTLPDTARAYQSEVLPSASTPGLQITLILFADGTLEMVSDYQEPGQVVIELGTWAAADDGTVIVTLTGQLNRNYEPPVELAFTTTDTGALSLVDEDGLLFGEDGLTLVPLTEAAEATPEPSEEATAEPGAEATTEPVEEATAEPTAEETPAVVEEAVPTAEPEAEATPETETTPDAEATATPEADTAAEDAASGEVGMAAGAPDGPYVSDLLPAADAAGFFQVAVFYANGDLLLSSYYLNGEPPVLEVGTWAADVPEVTDGAALTDTVALTDTTAVTATTAPTPTASMVYTVTLTGTVDEAYENPVIIQLIAQEDGILELDGVALHALPEAAMEMSAAVAVAQFESEIMPAASAPGLQIRLTLFDDSSLEMISDFQEPGEVVTEVGEWLIDDDGNLVVTLTGQPGQPYEEPVTLQFAIGEDDTLTLIDEEGLFGDEGLTLMSVPLDASDDAATGLGVVEEEATATPSAEESAADATVEPETTPTPGAEEPTPESETPSEPLPAQTGLYQSEVLPSASSPGLQVSLALLDGNAVAMEYDYLNDEEVVTNVGTWEDNGDGTLTVTLDEGPSGAFDEPVVFGLTIGGESLTIVEADEANAGLVDVQLVYLPLE